MTGEERKRILIVKPSALGDIVLALPALSALRRSFPNAKISWLVRPEFAPLIMGHPYIDDIILFDRKRLSKWWCNVESFKAFRSLIKQLKAGQFDLVFDFQGLFRTGYLSWVTGCKKRFGMAGARELAHIFYTDKITQEQSDIHLVDYYLKIAASAGAKQVEAEFKLSEDAGATSAVEKLLKSQGISGKYAVLVPGAAKQEKIWPIERFAELAEKISSRFGLQIVATGSQSEREYIETMGKRVINLAGKTTVRELVPLMKKASLVVSNDTGPGHIAAALSVPIVMIYGPTNPARSQPYNRPESIVGTEPKAMGMKMESFDPRYSINHITVEQVFENVYQQIGEKGSPSTPLRAG